MLSSAEIVKLLQDCSSELLWMSEADYPWKVLLWSQETLKAEQAGDVIATGMPEPNLKLVSIDPVSEPISDLLQSDMDSGLDGDRVLAQLQLPQDTLWREAQEEEFWWPVAADPAYQKLRAVIAEHLINVKIFLVGEIEIDVHIVGRTAQNDFIGLATKMVET